jgi:hypothetical protein
MPAPTPQAQFSVSSSVLAFNATEPKSAKPAGQTLTGTVTGTISGTTLYILVGVAGSVIETVSAPVISGDSGSVLVTPVEPMSLGAGTFTGTMTVRACVDSPTCASGELSGSPRTVNVTYTVGSSVQGDSVMPHVVARDAAGLVVIRGSGLSGVTSVSFGSWQGTVVAVRSSTEVSAQHVTMPPGTYTVSLNGGTIPFTGSLVVAESPAFATAKLPYPDVPVDVPALVYDAERRALLVAERYADRGSPSNPALSRILRYTFDGANWSAGVPSPETVHRLRDLAISPRGDRVIALREADVSELDATTLAFIESHANPPSTLEYMRFIALLNDGYALISSDYYGSGSNPQTLYSLSTRTFTTLGFNTRVPDGIAAASGDGSRGLVVGGTTHKQYDASNGTIRDASALTFSHTNDYRPAIDRTGSRIVVGNGTETSVLAGDYSLLCTLPSTTRAYTISPFGNRAFALSSASKLQAYQVVNASGGPCPPDGPEINVDDPGIDPSGFGFPYSNVQMTISPDGGTLFMAGIDHVVVQPWPPGP